MGMSLLFALRWSVWALVLRSAAPVSYSIMGASQTQFIENIIYG